MALSSDILQAAAKYGPQLDSVAAQYRNPYTGKPLSGEALLLKLVKGESGGRKDAVSNVGARGYGQFMPGTRQAVLKLTGGKVDPWRSADEAVHAAVLHLTGKLGHRKGLEGYNPGMPTYPAYILGQKVGKPAGGGRGSGGAKGGGSVQSGTPGSVQVTPGEGYSPDMAPGGTGVADLIAALTQKPQQAGSVGIESPDFSSTQYLATSGPTPVGGGGPVQQPQLDVMALLDAVGRGPDISGQVDGPSVSVTPGGSAPSSSPGGSSQSGGQIPGLRGKGSGLKELFYDPQGGWDNGKSIGAIGGHSDHIHVAAGPNTLKAVAELARKKGLHISDFEPYDKVDPVHTNGSFHYSGRAADLSGSPKQMAQFTRLLRDYFGLS